MSKPAAEYLQPQTGFDSVSEPVRPLASILSRSMSLKRRACTS